MTWVCVVHARRFVYCGELNVRFLRPVSPGQPMIAAAELVQNRRNRFFLAEAELKNEAGAVFAAATGKYMPLKPTDAAEMATDFIGDLTSFLGSTPVPATT
jgi:acyl-coenzyme A thioesterase PaaI-like protein